MLLRVFLLQYHSALYSLIASKTSFNFESSPSILRVTGFDKSTLNNPRIDFASTIYFPLINSKSPLNMVIVCTNFFTSAIDLSKICTSLISLLSMLLFLHLGALLSMPLFLLSQGKPPHWQTGASQTNPSQIVLPVPSPTPHSIHMP